MNDAFDVLGEVIRIRSGQLAAVAEEMVSRFEIDVDRRDLRVQMLGEVANEALTEHLEVLLVHALPRLLFDPVGEQVANDDGQVAGVLGAQVVNELRFAFDLDPT